MNRLNVESLLSVKLKRRNLLIGAGGLAGFAIASQFSDRVIAQPSFSGYPFTLFFACRELPFKKQLVKSEREGNRNINLEVDESPFNL